MRLRLIPELDGYPKFIEQAQTVSGKIALLFLFALPLWFLNGFWRQTLLVLTIVTFLPQFRRAILTIAAPLLAILYPGWIPTDVLLRIVAREGWHAPWSVTTLASIATVAVILCLTVIAAVVYRKPKAGWLKRPLVLWHTTFCALVLGAALLPLHGAARVTAWAFVFALSGYFWYFCYTILDRTAAGRDSVALQEGAWQPAWTLGSGSATPFVKGAAYLRHIEAKTPRDLAVAQLKAVKLIWWCTMLRLVLAGINVFIHGELAPLAIPTFPQAFAASVARHPFPVAMCWASLILAFLESVLNMSIWGHQIVACCRMAGFQALRNTYRPFEARTIAEFWNRYYFYFKELLVDIFFYPTFLRYFKSHPRLRKFAATFMAAAVGNMLFHFFRDIYYCAELGLWPAVAGFRVYAAYCVVLGATIGISQLRSSNTGASVVEGSWFRRQLWPGICVGGFYCILHIFDDTGRALSLSQHFQFAADLFPFRRLFT